LDENKLVEFYNGGLCDVIQQEVKIKAHKTMKKSIQMAKVIEVELCLILILLRNFTYEIANPKYILNMK